MYVLSEAIKKAGSADPADITKALRGINGYAPVTGTMTWDDKGELRYGAVGVYELRKGNWGCACGPTVGDPARAGLVNRPYTCGL